jgi:hypothetical protein
MALEKTVAVDKIEIVQNNIVQVRTVTIVLEDGAELNRSFHRHVVTPGSDYSNEDPRVKAICQVLHTPEVVSAYEAARAAMGV